MVSAFKAPRWFVLLVGCTVTASISLAADGNDPAKTLLNAYTALSAKDYDRAISLFQRSLTSDSKRSQVHKDLAYTYLKTGDNLLARDEFLRALELDKQDETAALEYAFLAFETKQPIEARRMFDRLRTQGKSEQTRKTAAEAFRNIDGPLGEGIARWKAALTQAKSTQDVALYSAHHELADLAEKRDELELAAEQYQVCRQLKPGKSSLLLDEARIWAQLNRLEEAHAAILAASRSADPRTAETALELWGDRYPYPYEFVAALKLDERNLNMRRELAFLYLAMSKQDDAVLQLQQVLKIDPSDRLAKAQLEALSHKKAQPSSAFVAPPTALNLSAQLQPDARTMGMKSFQLGYARDAVKYLQQAHQTDPDDAEVMLKLGYAYNWVHDDADAIQWFDRARHSADPLVAAEATKAYRNLSGDVGPQTTVWALPMYSTRWKDLFTYGQAKRTMPLPWQSVNKWLSLYFSTRFLGDLKSSMAEGAVAPQYLSESSFIVGAGASTKPWHHLTTWGEAGEAIKYLPFRTDIGAFIPDYRGGANYARGFGHLLGATTAGTFFETSADAIFVSRYNDDWILNSQNRTGFTFRPFGGNAGQLLWNTNFEHDLKNQYWANFLEFGPGLRFHPSWMRPGVYLTTDLLHGVYTNNVDNPWRPNYNDVRIGFWYAFTR